MNITWLNRMWACAAMGIFMAAIYTWRKQLSRSGKRVPVTEKLLRPPGVYLRCRLIELDVSLMDQGSLVAGLAGIFPFVVLLWPRNGHPIPELIFFAFATSILAVVGSAIIRILRLLNQRRNYPVGFSGERLVGEQLNKLMLDGCHVFHDLPANGIGNIDHVVAAPTGIYAIETKARRKGRTRNGQLGHEVISDGIRLHFPMDMTTPNCGRRSKAPTGCREVSVELLVSTFP